MYNKLDGHGRARREAARRGKSEWKVKLGSRNSSRSNGSTGCSVQRTERSGDWPSARRGAASAATNEAAQSTAACTLLIHSSSLYCLQLPNSARQLYTLHQVITFRKRKLLRPRWDVR